MTSEGPLTSLVPGALETAVESLAADAPVDGDSRRAHGSA